MKPEFLMLAHTFKNERIAGWWLSEKLDGSRAFWDGGISRGIPAAEVPYSNTVKDGRLLQPPLATGLWSRAGKVIDAPDWWLDKLPKGLLLDGELWLGYGRFQELRSFDNWEKIQYKVFDSPVVTTMFWPRTIKIRNEYEFFITNKAISWALDHGVKELPDWSFELRYLFLKNFYPNTVKQVRLPLNNDDALKRMEEELDQIVGAGGEGIMLRWGSSHWFPERSHYLLKHKPINTMDGVVVGYTSGKEGKTGQLLGKIGALILKLDNGKRLELSGLTHEQREIRLQNIEDFAVLNPGKELPSVYSHHLFQKGIVVEFKYRELSDDDIPKEARFWRIKE